MMYAILCFASEDLGNAQWSPGQDAENMARIGAVTDKHKGDIAHMARLLPVTSAVSVRKSQTVPLVLDGPFIESKEHLVGFYLIECDDIDEAIGFAKELMTANPWGSGYEVRPIHSLKSGS